MTGGERVLLRAVGVLAAAAAVVALAGIRPDYFVGEYTASVARVPELMLYVVANAAALMAIAVVSLLPDGQARAAAAMAVPVGLGAALARLTSWLESRRSDFGTEIFGTGYRYQTAAGVIAGLAAIVALVALGFSVRRRRVADGFARAAGIVGLIGVACLVIGHLGDWFRYRINVVNGPTYSSGGGILSGSISADAGLVLTFVVLAACALAVGGTGSRTPAVGFAVGVLAYDAIVLVSDLGVFTGVMVAENGVSPTIAYLWRVIAAVLAVVALVLISRARFEASDQPTD